MNSVRRCLACGNLFPPLPHVPNQHFCSAAECQRERRRRWQRKQLRIDPDYRDNQARAQANWRARHPDYWRHYRATHPSYRARNCALQRGRNRHLPNKFANMDGSQLKAAVSSGFYILRSALETDLAKMNAFVVHISVLSTLSRSSDDNCKEMT
ncbi:hypothetical protein [Paraburkholderia polaris]|uniref:hypothetical protein n=1 Tax=Paraburkholderia polaris TaxID=2728848 RepID=UPI00146BD502|nr:hypothetical protein [Paraburkholderia polaris]